MQKSSFKYLMCILFVPIFIQCGIQKLTPLYGKYDSVSPDRKDIEVLELEIDSTFNYSGYIEEDDKRFFSCSGIWATYNDTLVLNSVYNDDGTYDTQVDHEFINQFVDSIRYLEEDIIFIRDYKFEIEDSRLIKGTKDIRIFEKRLK